MRLFYILRCNSDRENIITDGRCFLIPRIYRIDSDTGQKHIVFAVNLADNPAGQRIDPAGSQRIVHFNMYRSGTSGGTLKCPEVDGCHPRRT